MSGFFANFINYAAYALLISATVSVFLAAIVGYVAGTFVAFVLNSSWVFKSKNKSQFMLSAGRQALAFVLLHSVSAVLMGALTATLVEYIGIGIAMSFVIAAVPIALLNYVVLGSIVFRDNKVSLE